jgi:hypothetical protein
MSKKIIFKENCHFDFEGQVFMKFGTGLKHEDVVKNPDYYFKNLIVNSASTLIAEWANADDNNANHIPGILYLAVGTGDDGWDRFNPPLPNAGVTQLVHEVYRVKRTPSVLPYVDSLGNNTATPTPIVDYEFSFLSGTVDNILDEMGLFGGLNASTANSGTEFNYLTFSAISKPLNSELTIVWRINFLPTGV